MDEKNKFMKICFALISYPIYWLANIIIFANLFNLKEDYIKIISFQKSNKEYHPLLLKALIAGEDHRFYLHIGFDPISIIRAIVMVYVKKTRQGGSTIEQQLVRVITNRYDVSICRKLREILLATVLSHSFTKEEVLNAYLAIAYFGWKMNGIEAVFSRLNITNDEITVVQACSVIARLKYPEPEKISAKIVKKIKDREVHIYLKVKESTEVKSIRRRERWLRSIPTSLMKSGWD